MSIFLMLTAERHHLSCMARDRFASPPSCRRPALCATIYTMLQLINLSKDFAGTTLFSNISWHLKKGERVALVGENGADKSTLIKIVAGPTELFLLFGCTGDGLIDDGNSRTIEDSLADRKRGSLKRGGSCQGRGCGYREIAKCEYVKSVPNSASAVFSTLAVPAISSAASAYPADYIIGAGA